MSPCEPALSNLIGYEDSTSDDSSSSDSSQHKRRTKKRKRRRRSSSDESSQKSHSGESSHDDKTDDQSDNDHRQEETERDTLSSDVAAILPVHTKPAHIVAEPVINAPPPEPVTQEAISDLEVPPVSPTPAGEQIKQDDTFSENGGEAEPETANGEAVVSEAVSQQQVMEEASTKDTKPHSKDKKKKKDKKEKVRD